MPNQKECESAVFSPIVSQQNDSYNAVDMNPSSTKEFRQILNKERLN